MADVFVSYAQKDKAWVEKFVNALQAQGWEVWWDLEIRAGERIDRAIERTLSLVKCVVVVWSHNAYDRDWVREEAHWAKEHDKLLSIRTEVDLRLPIGFTGVLTDDFSGWDDSRDSDEFRKLEKDIQSVVGAPQSEEKPGLSTPSPQREPLSSYRDRLRDGGKGPEMVVIPAGPFWMGSPDDEAGGKSNERPRHRVEIKRRFALGKTPVTFDEYDHFVEATGGDWPEDEGWGRGKRPVINVDWEDAIAYTIWLSEQTGKRYRLPTEAEWECACRAGTQTPWFFGDKCLDDSRWFKRAETDILAQYAWYGNNSDRQTHPVGEKEPNPWGLHDMQGNVWEWVQECWHGTYEGAPNDGTAWDGSDDGDFGRRVVRGGSWFHKPGTLRSAYRSWINTDSRFDVLGFRLAQDL